MGTWKIIVSINPTASEDGRNDKYYAELVKINAHGQLYNPQFYMYYNSPEEAWSKMYKFAKDEGYITDV